MKTCLLKKIIFFVLIIISFNSKATHIMGGEITWQCITDPLSFSQGKYVFTMKVYRDCDGNPLLTGQELLTVHSHPTISSITLNWQTTNDITPQGVGVNCLDCISNPVGAVEEYIYVSQPISLPGIPPADGWHFTWDACCRNGAIDNIVLSSTFSPIEGFTLRASMFPYTDPILGLLPADPCFDSSPIFKEQAKTILCTGYPFSYSNLGFDIELDSLSYSWDDPLDDPT